MTLGQCGLVQRWHNVVTPPTMTFFIMPTYAILVLYDLAHASCGSCKDWTIRAIIALLRVLPSSYLEPNWSGPASGG